MTGLEVTAALSEIGSFVISLLPYTISTRRPSKNDIRLQRASLSLDETYRILEGSCYALSGDLFKVLSERWEALMNQTLDLQEKLERKKTFLKKAKEEKALQEDIKKLESECHRALAKTRTISLSAKKKHAQISPSLHTVDQDTSARLAEFKLSMEYLSSLLFRAAGPQTTQEIPADPFRDPLDASRGSNSQQASAAT